MMTRWSVALAVLVLYTCMGCSHGTVERAECRITYGLHGEGERTLMPDVDLENASVTVEGVGPGGEIFSEIGVDGGCVVSELAPGAWSVTATLRSAETVLAQGTATVMLLAGRSTDCSVTLGPVEGAGVLAIALSWDAPASPQISAELTPMEGDPQSVEFVVDEYSASYMNESLATGYYLLTVTASQNETILGGIAESVCVLDGLTVSGSYDLPLSESLGPTSLGISLVLPNLQSLDPSDMLLPAFVFRGVTAVFTGPAPETVASGDTILPEGVGYEWYANGISIGSGRTIQVDTGDLAPWNRIDLVCGTVERQGSAAATLRVVDPVPIGAWSYFCSLFDGVGEIDGLSGSRAVCTLPAGESFTGGIISAGYDEDAIGLWRWEQNLLTPVRILKRADIGGMGGPADVAVSPDGLVVAVAARKTDSVGFLSIGYDEAEPADLEFHSIIEDGVQYDGLVGVESVSFSPDGAFLYAAAGGSNTISVFRFDGLNDDDMPPERVQLLQATDVTVDSTLLDEPIRLAVTGDRLFCTAWSGDAVIVFERDAVTGLIHYAQHFRDGTDPVQTLNAPSGIGVTPDGESVYVASYYDNAVTHFSRGSDGVYAYSGYYRDGEEGVEGLRYCRDVCISPDGSMVATAGAGDDAVALFGRDVATGTLSYSGSWSNADPGVTGLDGCRALRFTPTGDALVAGSSNDNALSIFTVWQVSED